MLFLLILYRAWPFLRSRKNYVILGLSGFFAWGCMEVDFEGGSTKYRTGKDNDNIHREGQDGTDASTIPSGAGSSGYGSGQDEVQGPLGSPSGGENPSHQPIADLGSARAACQNSNDFPDWVKRKKLVEDEHCSVELETAWNLIKGGEAPYHRLDICRTSVYIDMHRDNITGGVYIVNEKNKNMLSSSVDEYSFVGAQKVTIAQQDPLMVVIPVRMSCIQKMNVYMDQLQ